MAAADLVVAMAGYNTLVEIVTLGKRALIIPRDQIAMEQLMRAALFERLGLIRMLHPDRLSPENLAEVLLAGLQAPAPSRQQLDTIGLDLNGLQRVTAHVHRLLSERGLLSGSIREGSTDRPAKLLT
jgi:predicted glycosyltransferase